MLTGPAQQVNYTVIYWQENANWDNQYLNEASRDKVQYSYVKSETKKGHRWPGASRQRWCSG